jgi:small subunit ribosomal protein S2
MVTLPTLPELLEAGVHFGHKTARWNPKMKSSIFASKSGVHIINLEKTQEQLKAALDFIASETKAGKTIVFVGTKKQAQEIVKKAAESCGMPYVTARWLGGTLTNFDIVQRAFKKLERSKLTLQSKEAEEMTKRDKSLMQKDIEKSERLVGGLVNLQKRPDILILIGAYDEKNAILEANMLGIPTIALVDSNADPRKVTYPIAANDDATKSIFLFSELFAKVIRESRVAVSKRQDTSSNNQTNSNNK